MLFARTPVAHDHRRRPGAVDRSGAGDLPRAAAAERAAADDHARRRPSDCWPSPTSSGCSPTSRTPATTWSPTRRTPSSRSPSTARRTATRRTPSASTTSRIRLATTSPSSSTAMTDLPATVGDDQLGPEEPYVADAVPDPGDAGRSGDAVGRRRADDRRVAGGAPVRLADAADCASRAGERRRRRCSPTPRQLTFFTDGGVTYQVSVGAAPPRPDAVDPSRSTARRRSAAPRRAPSCGTPPRRRRGRSPR